MKRHSHVVVNKPATNSAPPPAGEPWVESLPRSLLLLSAGLIVFFLLKDLHSGFRWDEIAFDITDYSIAVTFAVIAVLVRIGLRIHKLWGGQWPAELNKTSFSRLETLRSLMGLVWALLIFLAPWLALFLNIFDLTPSNWRVLLGLRASLFVLIPVLCILPLLRFVRGRAALPILAFLAVGTAFPALIGLQSAIDVVRGPEWQTASITTFGADELNLVKLSDGRFLRYRDKLDSALQSGNVHRLLVLRASRYILDAR